MNRKPIPHSPLSIAEGFAVRHLGLADYEPVWQQMKSFTLARDPDTPDELWQVEHAPVYTLGVAARPEHLPRTDNGIPVVKTDRGGQITYHSPGQVIVYTLLDLRRRNIGVRALVRRLEQAVIELLGTYGIDAHGREDAPGVYVADAKIAALGLRIRNGCCYHGLSLNVDMDLTPFAAINPCGYPGLEVTQLRNLGVSDTTASVAGKLLDRLAARI
ncbi:MAG: lipoyl(octanoyl) transferase LipB [Betaproteobacteria bacterium]